MGQHGGLDDAVKFGGVSFVTWITIILIFLNPVESQLDTSLCTPNTKGGAVPLPALPASYASEIQWTSLLDRWIYYVREDFDTFRQKSVLRVSLPLLTKDAKVIYDLTHGYVSIFGDGGGSQGCKVHQPDGSYFTFNDLMWLSGLYHMMKHVESGMDVTFKGITNVDGVQTYQYSACLYEYENNQTAFYNFYYIENSNTQKVNWVPPHYTGREPHTVFPHYVTIDVSGPKYKAKVQGHIGRFDMNPDFQDEEFLPPAGVWCEGLPLTSLPVFPTQFSAMSEVVDLDFQKVSYEWLWFDSESKFVRWDWKDVDNSQGSNNPDPFSYIYNYNIGVKYSIDRNLETCSLPSLIALGDDYSAPTRQDHGPFGKQFKMAEPDIVFFHNKGLFHQKIGRQTIRGVPCDVYIGLYLDDASQRNFTVQWYFTAQGWSINSDEVLAVGAFFKMELWTGASQHPLVRNIIEYTPIAPFQDVFDVSMCYSASQKIHFVLLVKVIDPEEFPQVTRRTLKQLLISVLNQFIAENNRFAPLELDYDGNQTLYVYTSLLERVPLDNPNIVHTPQHNMEAAFHFMRGSIRAHRHYTVRSIHNTPVVLVPYDAHRIDFDLDFTTPTPSASTTTPELIAPSKRHSTTTTTTTTTAATTTPTTTTKTTTTTTSPPSTTKAAKVPTLKPRCPPCGKATCNCEQKCTAVKEASTGSNGATTYSIGALVGSMIGFLVLGLVLGFVLTRLYHVKRLISPVPLFQKADENF